jgi:hypothetical protein
MAYIKPVLGTLDSWKVFTNRIYKDWDADPGYYAIQHTALPSSQRLRMAVAWCAYYNLGIAADASEKQGKRFWQYLVDIYPTAKRSTERRHFRGGQGMRALEQWRTNWPRPEALADFMCDGTSYFDVRKAGKQVMQYGDYFFWKWSDLHEVLGYGPVDMTGSEKHSPLLPKKGAGLIYELAGSGLFEDKKRSTDAIVEEVYAEIVHYGRRHAIPPRTTKGRPFGIQEAETVCCVYKQMHSGSYTYGTRTAKAVRRLRAASSATARNMAEALLELSPYSEPELNRILDSLTE